MDYKTILNKMRDVRAEFCKYTSVPAYIGGVATSLNETDVRAIQVIASRLSDAEFEDFSRSVIIWNGPKEKATEIMRFRRDGKFENEFLPGFFDSCTNMVFEIL